jgi:hypothetical protein
MLAFVLLGDFRVYLLIFGLLSYGGLRRAARAADPVYRLLGKRGLGTVDMPAPNLSLVDGELAFREHDGGHTDAPDWPIFLKWARRYLEPRQLPNLKSRIPNPKSRR